MFSPSLQIQLAHPLVNISFSPKLTCVFSVESTTGIRCPHCDHPIKTDTPTESDASTKPQSTNNRASRVRRRRQVCIKTCFSCSINNPTVLFLDLDSKKFQ